MIDAVVDDVHDRFQRDGDDARAAGAADHHEVLPSLVTMVGLIEAERPLARRDGVVLALDQAEEVGGAGLGGEIVHLVVEEEAGVAGDHPGAEIAR